jgi:hypothetical protein
VLDRRDISREGIVDVLTELAMCATLAKEIPALVECLFELSHPTVVDHLAGAAKPVLFVDHLADPFEDLVIVHGWSPPVVGWLHPW